MQSFYVNITLFVIEQQNPAGLALDCRTEDKYLGVTQNNFLKFGQPFQNISSEAA